MSNMNDKSISALILCPDAELSVFGRSLVDCNIAAETRLTTWAAQQALQQQDFEMLFLDVDESEAGTLLDTWNNRGPNSSKVTIAVSEVPEMLKQAQMKHAHLVLQKPLPKALVEKTVRVAAEIVLKKRRASYRHSVNIKCHGMAQDSVSKWRLENVALLDISQNGLCMKYGTCLPQQTKVELSFYLPETRDLVRVAGKVVWSEPNGVAGVYFVGASKEDSKKLGDWLDERNPVRDTLTVVDNPNQRREGYFSGSRYY